jgi:hypothetical protein
MSWFKIQSIFFVAVISLLLFTVTGVTALDRFGNGNRTEFDPAAAKWPWFNQSAAEPATPLPPALLPDRGQSSDQTAFNPEGARWPWFNNNGLSNTSRFGSVTPPLPSDRVAFNPENARWPQYQMSGASQAPIAAKESVQIRDVNRLNSKSRLNRR